MKVVAAATGAVAFAAGAGMLEGRGGAAVRGPVGVGTFCVFKGGGGGGGGGGGRAVSVVVVVRAGGGGGGGTEGGRGGGRRVNVEVSSSRSVDPRGDGSCHARGGELLVLLVRVVVMVVVVVVGRGRGVAVVEMEGGRAGRVGRREGREVAWVVVGEGVMPLSRQLSLLSLNAGGSL